jgi:hypothetical protein
MKLWWVLGSILIVGCSDPGPGAAVDAGRRHVAGDASTPRGEAGTTDGGEAEGDADAGAGEPDGSPAPSTVELITFNWPARYGPTSGVDLPDRRLWADLAGRASVLALQEAGWIAGWIRGQGWRVHRPNPPGDDDDQPVGNLLVWDPGEWQTIAKGWHRLSPKTRIQKEAAGPTWHRPKYVVWAHLRRRSDGVDWVFGSVHFVPSKHLGGAALALWKLQRDNLLDWWARQSVRTAVMGDFNAQPGDAVAQPFWQVARRQTAPSHGSRRIDWIVRKRPLSGSRGEALDNRDQSDHKPVFGRIRWQ